MKIYIINVPSNVERKLYQVEQLESLRLPFEIVQATTVEDIESIYDLHRDDWQRPLRKVELACYISHQKLWQKIASESEAALILEDDALLCSSLPEIIDYCSTLKNIDHITLETVGRKKFLGQDSIEIQNSHFKLTPLVLDRNGAGAYILYPSGAKKLLEYEKKHGVALADAQITACFELNSYQLEPACSIQMDQCHKYALKSPIEAFSNIGSQSRPKIPKEKWLLFKSRRLAHQLRLALRQLRFSFKAKYRRVELNKEDFK